MNQKDKNEIKKAIAKAEKMTSGEIRVHLQKKCIGNILNQSEKVFVKLGMHKTKEKNGVLIFIALDSRRFAIIGDKGIHERVGAGFWDEVKDKMATLFSEGALKEGIITGIMDAGEKLKKYFPGKSDDKNELSDDLSVG